MCLKWQNRYFSRLFAQQFSLYFGALMCSFFILSTSGSQPLNEINDVIPSGSGLSMGVVENLRMNKAQAAADAAAPVATNVLNDAFPDCGGLSMVVVATVKMNEAQYSIYAAVLEAAATSNAPAAPDTVYFLEAANTSNVPAAETPQLGRHFLYDQQNLMADKECFWRQHDNIPPNVIDIFENDLMYGRVFLCHVQVQTSLTVQFSGMCHVC